LITPDLRGSGRSVFAGTLDWDLLADDLAAVLRALGISRAAIGGVSFGAGCAVRFALRHPAMTTALLVLNPAFAGADVGLTPAQSAAMRAMATAGERALVTGISALYPLLETLPVGMRERARATIDTYDPASVAATTAFMASGLRATPPRDHQKRRIVITKNAPT
jgi:pimeloyl-ACP methyl ester carboxylesterase